MKIIKKYYPEFIFIGGSILAWTLIFTHTNVGHNVWEMLQSITLVFFLNVCAFTGVHIFFQQLRHRNPATRLFFIVKPDGMAHLSHVLHALREYGELKNMVQVDFLPRTLLEKHYSHIVDKPFFDSTVAYMQSGPVLLGIIECRNEQGVEFVRAKLGATDLSKASPATLRGKYGKVVNGEFHNVVHVSDSYQNGAREIEIWEQLLKL